MAKGCCGFLQATTVQVKLVLCTKPATTTSINLVSFSSVCSIRGKGHNEQSAAFSLPQFMNNLPAKNVEAMARNMVQLAIMATWRSGGSMRLEICPSGGAWAGMAQKSMGTDGSMIVVVSVPTSYQVVGKISRVNLGNGERPQFEFLTGKCKTLDVIEEKSTKEQQNQTVIKGSMRYYSG